MDKIKNKKGLISLLFKILYYIVIVFACLIAIILLYYMISSQLNANNENYKPKISLYTIVSPSMTPVINVYDLVLNIRVDNPTDIEVGDIITYKSNSSLSDGMTITHRVIAIDRLPDGTYEYLTQGDNNSEPDSLYVTYDQVIGKEILIIPYIGRLQFLVANKKYWLYLLLIPITIYTFIQIYKLINLFTLRKKVIEVKEEDNKELERLKEQEIYNNLRKERLKGELKNSDYIIQSNSNLMLESPNETIINVKENKYSKYLEDEKSKENLIRPNFYKENDNNSQYEILDTDELTAKIKEYDDKIEQLDKMIAEISSLNAKEIIENDIVEVDNYLIGNKIKVVNVESTKTAAKNKIKKPNNIDLPKDLNVSIDLKPLVTNINQESRISKNSSRKNKLNLNPQKIKKINRAGKSNSSSNKKKRLYLNPKNIKKVSRKQSNKEEIQNPKKEFQKDSKKIIFIEKNK